MRVEGDWMEIKVHCLVQCVHANKLIFEFELQCYFHDPYKISNTKKGEKLDHNEKFSFILRGPPKSPEMFILTNISWFVVYDLLT